MELGSYERWMATGDAFARSPRPEPFENPAAYEGQREPVQARACAFCGARFRSAADCKVCDRAAVGDEARAALYDRRLAYVRSL